jgi:hypothetical protein
LQAITQHERGASLLHKLPTITCDQPTHGHLPSPVPLPSPFFWYTPGVTFCARASHHSNGKQATVPQHRAAQSLHTQPREGRATVPCVYTTQACPKGQCLHPLCQASANWPPPTPCCTNSHRRGSKTGCTHASTTHPEHGTTSKAHSCAQTTLRALQHTTHRP